jgi:hypothetical protein
MSMQYTAKRSSRPSRHGAIILPQIQCAALTMRCKAGAADSVLQVTFEFLWSDMLASLLEATLCDATLAV